MNGKNLHVRIVSSLEKGIIGDPVEKYPELNKALSRIADEKNSTPTAVALAWILRMPARMQTVIGTTKTARLAEAAKACDVELSKREWYTLYLAAGNRLP